MRFIHRWNEMSKTFLICYINKNIRVSTQFSLYSCRKSYRQTQRLLTAFEFDMLFKMR